MARNGAYMKYVSIAATSSNKAIRDFSRKYALVAQWIECLTPNEKAAGSIPAGRTTALKASTRWNYSILTSAFFILPLLHTIHFVTRHSAKGHHNSEELMRPFVCHL